MSSVDHSLIRSQMSLRPFDGRVLYFFVLVPALIGVLLGATGAGVAQHFPWAIGIVFWIVASLGAWLCLFAGSAFAGVLLAPWRPPLWLILLAGAILGSIPGRYVVYGAAVALRDQMIDGRVPRQIPPFEFSADFLLYYLQVWASVYLTWVVVGLVFDRWLGLPRYSRSLAASSIAVAPAAMTSAMLPAALPATQQVAAAETESEAPLLQRLPDRIGRNVLALEAEDHYVRVHTDLGSTLVLARLSDAIADLGSIEGTRVHRSFWVKRAAVVKVSVHGKGLMLKLSNGIDVPVSQGYKELARQAGFTATDTRVS